MNAMRSERDEPGAGRPEPSGGTARRGVTGRPVTGWESAWSATRLGDGHLGEPHIVRGLD